VARGVDDVDVVLREIVRHALPEAGGRCGSNGDTALLFLLHPVHGGGTVVHFTNLVVHAGVEQHALGSGGFTGVDVSGDTDITVALNGGRRQVMKFLETNFRLPGRAISGDSRHVQEMNSAQAPSLVPDVFTIAVELTSAHDRDSVRHFGWIPSSPDCSIDRHRIFKDL
jgi:hypothetical protein